MEGALTLSRTGGHFKCTFLLKQTSHARLGGMVDHQPEYCVTTTGSVGMIGVRGEAVVLRRERRQHHADNLLRSLGVHRSDYVIFRKLGLRSQ